MYYQVGKNAPLTQSLLGGNPSKVFQTPSLPEDVLVLRSQWQFFSTRESRWTSVWCCKK